MQFTQKSKEHIDELITILKQEIKQDFVTCSFIDVTKLGLVEIARRREKDSIDNYYLSQCFVCKTGESIKSINRILDEIEKNLKPRACIL